MKKPKPSPVPLERTDTVRHEIIEALAARPRTARELSVIARVPEREVAGHLEHIRKSLASHKDGPALHVAPAECAACGFVFRGRERLTRPGKCPECRSTHILEPAFEVK